MVNFIFLKSRVVKLLEILHTVPNVKIIIFQIKYLMILLSSIMIYSFIKFKVLTSLPFTVRMHVNLPIDHAINHSSIGFNRLTIVQVFN